MKERNEKLIIAGHHDLSMRRLWTMVLNKNRGFQVVFMDDPKIERLDKKPDLRLVSPEYHVLLPDIPTVISVRNSNPQQRAKLLDTGVDLVLDEPDDLVSDKYYGDVLASHLRAILRRPLKEFHHTVRKDVRVHDVLITREGDMFKDADRITLPKDSKTQKLLMMLSDEPGVVVELEDILKNLWPHVSGDRALAYLRTYVGKLRHLMGDDVKNPRYIYNHRLGYRLGEKEDLQ